MKLYYSSSSPFARKVRVALREQRLQPRVQEIECNPFASPPELRAVNRLSKVPALVDGDGLCLYDSPVIVEYLDSLAPAHALIPPADGLALYSEPVALQTLLKPAPRAALPRISTSGPNEALTRKGVNAPIKVRMVVKITAPL